MPFLRYPAVFTQLDVILLKERKGVNGESSDSFMQYKNTSVQVVKVVPKTLYRQEIKHSIERLTK